MKSELLMQLEEKGLRLEEDKNAVKSVLIPKKI